MLQNSCKLVGTFNVGSVCIPLPSFKFPMLLLLMFNSHERARSVVVAGSSGEMRETLHEFEFRGETEDLSAFLSGGVRISSARAVRSSLVRVGR